MKMRRLLSCMMALLLAATLPLTAFAEPYDLANGSIEVKSDGSGRYVSQADKGIENHKETTETVITHTKTESNPTTSNTITIEAGTGSTANVTLSGVEKNNSGNLTITDDSGTDGSLTANGGEGGAGIGGGANGVEGKNSNASNITISGGTVKATGGDDAAGIGGGANGSGSNITISGGTVNATGGGPQNKGNGDKAEYGEGGGAGIGGGTRGNGSNIIISGGTVNATGGGATIGNEVFGGGAGIGGGANGTSDDISVKYTAQVTATGKGNAADIGNGYASEATEKQKDNVDLSGLSSFGKVNGVPGSDGGFHASNGSSSSGGSSGGSFVSFFGSNSSSSPSDKARLDVKATLGKITSTDNDDNALSHVVWLKEDSELDITAKEDKFSVTGNKADLLQLKEDGVKKINLQTNRVNVSVSNQVLDKITDSGGGFQLTADNTTVNLTATDQNNKKTLDMTLTANKQPEKGTLQVDFLSEESKEGAGDVSESPNTTLKVSTNAPEATLSYNRKFLNALMNSEFGKLALAVGNLLATVDGMLGAITTVNGSGSISIGDKSVIMDGLEFSAADSSGNDKLDDVLNEIKLKMENKAQGDSAMVMEVDAKAPLKSASLKVPGSALQSLMDQGVEETALSVSGKTTSFKNSNLLKQIQDSRLGSTATVTDKNIENFKAKILVSKN